MHMYSSKFVFTDVHFHSCVIVSHAPVVHQSTFLEPPFDCVYLNVSYYTTSRTYEIYHHQVQNTPKWLIQFDIYGWVCRFPFSFVSWSCPTLRYFLINDYFQQKNEQFRFSIEHLCWHDECQLAKVSGKRIEMPPHSTCVLFSWFVQILSRVSIFESYKKDTSLMTRILTCFQSLHRASVMQYFAKCAALWMVVPLSNRAKEPVDKMR